MESKYLCVRKGEGQWGVKKYSRDEATGRLIEEYEYEVRDGVCNCESFKFRKRCKHLKFVEEGVETRPVGLHEARRIVQVMMSKLSGEEFDWVRLDREMPYVRDEKGKVVEIRVEVKCRKKESKLTRLIGTWEGVRAQVKLL